MFVEKFTSGLTRTQGS